MTAPKTNKLDLSELSDVFIGLNTDFFNQMPIENEHLTLDYLGQAPSRERLILAAFDTRAKFNRSVVEAYVSGYAVWGTETAYFHVALVSFRTPQGNVLPVSFTKNWHITLEKSPEPLWAFSYNKVMDSRRKKLFSFEDNFDIYVGYKDADGVKHFEQYDLFMAKVNR
jgi:hypothetical protein